METVAKLEELDDVVVSMRGDECVARCLCLHDPGSTLNVSTSRFLTAINAIKVKEGDTAIRTVSGRTSAKNLYKLQLQAGGFKHNLAVVQMDGFSPGVGLTCLELGLLEMLLGFNKATSENINLPDRARDCHILIGNGEGNLDIVRIWDPRSVGLNHMYFSRDIKLHYCHFAVDKKVIVSGRFGTPDFLCSEDGKDNFPRFLVPAGQTHKAVKDLDKMLELLESPQLILNASSLVTNRLRQVGDLGFDPDSVLSQNIVNNISRALAGDDDNPEIHLDKTTGPATLSICCWVGHENLITPPKKVKE